jgi:ribonucleotide monophosphatase NagD (HAD superfamily)
VLSGATAESDIDASPIRPDYVIGSIRELITPQSRPG